MKLAILIFLVGFCVGMLVNEIILYFKKNDGQLKIDYSNPEKDIYRLELDDIDSLDRKRTITLKIVHNADLSQN